MNVLIAGCGPTGAQLAQLLEEKGHDISVLDEDPRALDGILAIADHSFEGDFLAGSPIDTDNLRQAGVENCDAVVAAGEEDNQNIMVAQMARELFGVKTVLACVSDPTRKKVFSERFGLQAVCMVNLAVEALVQGLEDSESCRRMTLGSSTAAFTLRPIEKEELGRPLSEVAAGGGELVFGVLRASGRMELNGKDAPVLRAGDSVVLCAIAD